VTALELTASRSDPDAIEAAAARGRPAVAVEVPTLLLIAATYAGWIALTSAYARWPLIIVATCTAALVTLHSSVQHEIVHGHPTRWLALNRLLGMVPLSLWLPFERYRTLHRLHHNDARLTDPIDDPESFYWTAADFARVSPYMRVVLRAQQTLAGRLLIGSWRGIGIFWAGEWRALRANVPGVRRVWIEHLLWCIPVILWITVVCRIPLWVYFGAVVLPANGLMLVRSFAEHRARPDVPTRIAIVEDSWILGPLFLFNNLHALHHEAPSVPWYSYPARYRRIRARLIKENGGLVYTSYFDVARRYLFLAHDQLQHPTDRVPLMSGTRAQPSAQAGSA
jgi:fatty acid desaturase